MDSSTDTKQRCSFFLHDGLSNQIILKCHPVKEKSYLDMYL